MPPQPAKLSSDLVRPVAKGQAAPTLIAPPADPEPLPPPAPANAGSTPAPVLPKPAPEPALPLRGPARQPAPAPMARVPVEEVNRRNLSVRVPVEMAEWLRVWAFRNRKTVQQLVETAIDEFRQRNPE